MDSAPPSPAADRPGGSDPVRQVLASAPVLGLSRYLLAEPLDRGGSGVVYAAYDPELERRVAIKLLMVPHESRGGMDRSVGERLLREAQALAQLSHPNVIAVHDVGTYELADDEHGTVDRRIMPEGVFIVMELVAGQRLDRWVLAEPRSRDDVLEVLVQAGRGLEAAHASGLVHRDFKPANVLVDEHGRPRVLDFGLARPAAVEPEPSSGPPSPSPGLLGNELTTTGFAVGTPRYMAPEQHEGEPVDARTDVYAFCVTTYELLCGRPPFAGNDWQRLYHAKKALAVERPPRQQVPAWLWRVLLAGLAPDPRRRPGSMRELLAAIEAGRRRTGRYLWGGLTLATALGGVLWWSVSEPACQGLERELAGAWDPTVAARVQQAFDGTALPYSTQSFEAVAQGLDRWSRGWVEAREEQCHAQQREPASATYGPWLTCLERRRGRLAGLTGLLTRADEEIVERAIHSVDELGDPRSCRDRVQVASTQGEPDEPLDAGLAELRALLGTHKLAQAETLAAELEGRAEQRGSGRHRAEATLLYARVLQRLGRTDEAQERTRRAIDQAENAADVDLACEATILLVDVLTDAGELTAADVVATLARSRVEAWAPHVDFAAPLASSVGALRLAQGRPEEAIHELERAIELRSADGSEPRLELAPIHAQLGQALTSMGRHEAALLALDRALTIYEATLGAEHPALASVYTTLGHAHLRNGELERTAQALARARALLDNSRDETAEATLHYELALLCDARAEYREAIEHTDRRLELLLRTRAPSHPSVVRTRALRARLLAAEGRREDAIQELERLLPLQERVLGRNNAETINTMMVLGAQLAELDQGHRARELMLSGLARTEAAHGPGSMQSATVRLFLARDYTRTGDLEEAERAIQDSLAVFETAEVRTPVAWQAIVDLAGVYHRQGDRAKEHDALSRAIELGETIFGAQHRRQAKLHLFRGRVRDALGNRTAARADLERAIELGVDAPWPPLLEIHARYALALSWAHDDPQQAAVWIERARTRLAELPAPDEGEEPWPDRRLLHEALDAWPERSESYTVRY